jgi:hypothetical protein
MSLVVVKAAGIVVIDGAEQIVKVGDLFEADHPAVARFPYLFGPVALRFPVAREVEEATAAPGPVEQATAAPGEKRAHRKSIANL